MNVAINGESVTLEGEMNVIELLKAREVKMPDMVTVELNGDILSRDGFETTRIQEGDKVEFLYFMGGGSAHR